jgi:hypothetical protein
MGGLKEPKIKGKWLNCLWRVEYLDQISMVKEQLVIFKRQVMDANLQNLIE